jgi:bifunctional non-homologous end joining protein LigD
MLAVSGERPTHGRWAYEVKWDGIRALVARDGTALHVVSRNGNDVTRRYPELGPLAESIPPGTVLDGEIVALDAKGRPDFQRLQRRMHVEGTRDIQRLRVEVPVTLMLFDALAIGDDVLIDRPYLDRRAALSDLGLDAESWRTPPNEVGDGATLFAWTAEHGLEGVVAKRVDSVYQPGRRSSDWVKVKHARFETFVVGGWLPGQGARADTLGALLLGERESDDRGAPLRYVGRVGTGFDERALTALREALSAITRPDSPFDAGPVPRGARFVEPVLSVRVRFAEWTSAGILRAPVFLGTA